MMTDQLPLFETPVKTCNWVHGAGLTGRILITSDHDGRRQHWLLTEAGPGSGKPYCPWCGGLIVIEGLP